MPEKDPEKRAAPGRPRARCIKIPDTTGGLPSQAGRLSARRPGGAQERSKRCRKKRIPIRWYTINCGIMFFGLQNGLEAPSHRIMFRLPSILGLSANNRSVRRIRASSSGSLARIFRNFGIGVDEGNAKVLDGPLSPSGEAL